MADDGLFIQVIDHFLGRRVARAVESRKRAEKAIEDAQTLFIRKKSKKINEAINSLKLMK